MAPIFWHFNTVAFEYSPVSAILLCLFLAVIYVGSLYVWTPGQHGRDHPSTIKLRFLRVGLVCILMIPFLWACSVNSYSVRARILFTWIGLRLHGVITASVLPLLLTMVLFLGPLTLHYLDGIFSIYKAHFHHMFEQMNNGKSLKEAMGLALFQFSYTTLFGAYSAFLFLRTGHLVAPAIAHSFCNHMGFPNFHEVMAYTNPKRSCVIVMFLIGLLLWCYLLYPLTEPSFYGNKLYRI
ncbi:CAAX prenyl protease 2 [Lamellibrachia satsuma]|nr:CAAX prenyl protease 2 [Lamellibrachia satsuma]